MLGDIWRGSRLMQPVIKKFFGKNKRTFARVVVALTFIWVGGALALRYTEGNVSTVRKHIEEKPATDDTKQARIQAELEADERAKEHAQQFGSLKKCLWNILVYLLSGLDSGIPETPLGKMAVTAVLILSLGVVSVITGVIASFLVELRTGRNRRMPKQNLSDHIVICNWNDKGVPIVRELHADAVGHRRSIVVVSDDPDAGELPDEEDLPQFRDVFLIKGDPTNEVTLKRAGVEYAHSVLVLTDPRDGDLADAKSMLVCMAVAAVCKEADRPKTHIAVEGKAASNVDHLARSGADEIVSANDYAMMILAQATLSHGLSTVYNRLLTFSSESNEIYFVPVPAEFVGRSFTDLAQAVSEGRNGENPAVLIGAKTKEGISINPKASQLKPFEKGDLAVVIAFCYPQPLVKEAAKPDVQPSV
jgi:voltage-gated potassium channel